MQQKNDLLTHFYTFAIEQITIGVHAVNHEGKTIIYNQKMKEIEGLALEDVQDRSILELFNFDQAESTLLKVLQSKQPLLNVKQTYWNRNGIEITTVNDTFPIFEDGELIGAIELARDVTALEKLIHRPFQQTSKTAMFSNIISASDAMQTVISTAKKAANARLPVLLIGETGNGKDLIAESIHQELSPKNQHFYTLHCHRADGFSLNKLEEDLVDLDSYTLFCERIDLLTIPNQEKLLVILSKLGEQNKQFIASIGDDPVELIASGDLLKDLYYFFASFAIQITPLRKRQEDILPFVEAYLTRNAAQYNSALQNITPEVKEIFYQYDWPGNIRELEFLLKEITSLATTETTITYEMLPHHFRLKNETHHEDFIIQSNKDLLPLDEYLHEAEFYYIEKAMKLYNHNVTQTANALGMSRQSLQYRLRKLKNER